MKLRTFTLLSSLLFTACQPATEKTPAKEATGNVDRDTRSADSPATAVQVDTFKNIPQTKLIIPGERIGETYLDEAGAELFAARKKPDAGDAAMGKAWSTWYSKPAPGDIDTTRYELNVFTSRRNGVPGDVTRVKMIRVTSPFFATKTRVSAKRPLEYVKSAFPGVKKVGVFPLNDEEISVYDDEQSGLAFEFLGDKNSSLCRAVIVHEKGKSVLEQFAGLHNDLKKL